MPVARPRQSCRRKVGYRSTPIMQTVGRRSRRLRFRSRTASNRRSLSTEMASRVCVRPSLRRRSALRALESMPSSYTAPTVTCCTSFSRRSPTGATMSMAAAWRTACAFRSKSSMRCASPSRPIVRLHARIRYRLGGWRLGYRSDNRLCAGAGSARLRSHSRIERRPHSVPANPARTELSGAARARREKCNTRAGDRRRAHYRV